MNKTLIALAIAAALPVAAQADATISGSVNTKYKISGSASGSIDTDSRLSVASSEVLANGMTATAGFSITADHDDDTENSGTAGLAGDFGTLTVGSIDADGAFQAGDVAGVVSNTTESTSSTSSSVFGIHYAGNIAGLSVAAQMNAGTGPGSNVNAVQTKSSQVSATYMVNDLTLGYSYASAEAEISTVSTANHDGIHEGQSALGVSYAFGDLVVSAGKVNKKTSASPDAVISATYTMAMDALTVVAQVDNYHSATDSSDYQVNISYAVNDALTLSSEIDKNKDTSLVATYTAGNMTATVAKTDDGTTDASVTLDYGNADLSIGRVGARSVSSVNPGGSAEYTHVSYKVAF
jgi:hypothetical protein